MPAPTRSPLAARLAPRSALVLGIIGTPSFGGIECRQALQNRFREPLVDVPNRLSG
jgi:hypothetical protein